LLTKRNMDQNHMSFKSDKEILVAERGEQQREPQLR